MNFFCLGVLSFSLFILTQCQSLPKKINKCHFEDTKCIKDSINAIIRSFPKGIPEIGLRPIDIVDVKDSFLVNEPQVGSAWVNFKLINQVNYGFENTTITKILGFGKDPTASVMEIHGHIPSLTYKGQYRARGRMLWFLDMDANGDTQSEFLNFRFELKLKVSQEYRNNKRYLKIYELVPVINLDRWIIWMDNFFKENTDLTIALNYLFNKNWLEIWNELEPGILDIFSSVFTDLVGDIFSKVAYDDMFLSE